MFFILQKEKKLDLEPFIVQGILEQNRIMDEYIHYKKEDFSPDVEYPRYIKTAIPVGTIDFVESWLKTLHGIHHINPIEVPLSLRKEEFLKRNYSIVDKEKIPKTGHIFLKDVSRLKKFSGEIECERFFASNIWSHQEEAHDAALHLDPNHLYQVSEVVSILSEYRIYVMDNEIEAIANYNGDPCIFLDITLIRKMINIYSMQKDCPRAYTMDIAINERGTFLLEIHPWLSIGLYSSLWSRKLLYAYRYGIDYVLNFNTEPVRFEK